jgi:hypothetical protein
LAAYLCGPCGAGRTARSSTPTLPSRSFMERVRVPLYASDQERRHPSRNPAPHGVDRARAGDLRDSNLLHRTPWPPVIRIGPPKPAKNHADQQEPCPLALLLISSLRLTARAAGVLVGLTGLVVLFGRWQDVSSLKSALPGLATWPAQGQQRIFDRTPT